MLSNQKPLVEKIIEPLVKPLSGINPNTLTLLGSIPPLLFFVFVIKGWYLAALIAFIGSLFDLVDGMIARKYNKVTAFGGFLDSTLDRVADFFIITAFAFADIVSWTIIAPVLLFSFLISYTRGTSEKLAFAKGDHTTKFNVGIIERTERLIAVISALIFYAIFPTLQIAWFNVAEVIFIILGALSFYTFFQRVLHAYKKL